MDIRGRLASWALGASSLPISAAGAFARPNAPAAGGELPDFFSKTRTVAYPWSGSAYAKLSAALTTGTPGRRLDRFLGLLEPDPPLRLSLEPDGGRVLAAIGLALSRKETLISR